MFDPISIRATELPAEGGKRRVIYRGDIGIEQAILEPDDEPDEVQRQARQRFGVKVYGQIAAHLTDLFPKVMEILEAQEYPALDEDAAKAFSDFTAVVDAHVNGLFGEEDS